MPDVVVEGYDIRIEGTGLTLGADWTADYLASHRLSLQLVVAVRNVGARVANIAAAGEPVENGTWALDSLSVQPG